MNLIISDGSTGDDGKPAATFIKSLAFGMHVNTARIIRKGDRVYCEGQFSASIWKTNEGEPRLDLTLKVFRLERTGRREIISRQISMHRLRLKNSLNSGM